MRIRILSLAGKFPVSLFVVLVLGADTYAATVMPRENPYAKTILDRNIFNLNKGRPAEIVVPPPLPPPRITLQGLTNIVGRRQVLFQVQMPAKPGEPAKSCVLSEGERWGEIEVLAIDEKSGTVKFNNHGVLQTLNLKDNGRPLE